MDDPFYEHRHFFRVTIEFLDAFLNDIIHPLTVIKIGTLRIVQVPGVTGILTIDLCRIRTWLDQDNRDPKQSQFIIQAFTETFQGGFAGIVRT